MTEPSHFLTPCHDIKKWIIEGKWGRARGQMGYTQAEGLEELCAELSLGRAGWEWAPRTSSQPQMFFSSRPSGGASSDTAWPCGSSCVPTNLSSCCASAGYGTPAPLRDLLCSALPAAAQMCVWVFSPLAAFLGSFCRRQSRLQRRAHPRTCQAPAHLPGPLKAGNLPAGAP